MSDQCRLTAIMFTDLVGYTALMGRDAGSARTLVERSRVEIKAMVEAHHGQWLEAIGDASLSVFPSASEAADCALALQDSLLDDAELTLRISLHLGDVEFADGHVYGDGVNVAARVEPLADPGGIAITESMRVALRGHPHAIRHLGRKHLKNVDEPVNVYALDTRPQANSSAIKTWHKLTATRRTFGWATLGIALCVLGVLAWWDWQRYYERSSLAPEEQVAAETDVTATPVTVTSEPVAQAVPAKSIAVLPFENLSSDKNNAYFVAGMQDLILTKLAGIGDLKVISRTSTEQYASHPGNLGQIAQELGVATILEGSVQKIGNEVLITVQLVNASTDHHIWAHSYQRTLNDIFGVEGEVAGKIATALNVELSSTERARLEAIPTDNRAAYDLFLRGEYQANRGTLSFDIQSWKAAISLYRQAIAEDSRFALAYARLSFIESVFAWHGDLGLDTERLERQARADAKRALELAPELAAAWLALGFCDYFGREDYPGALEAFAHALALRPNYAQAYAARGFILRRQAQVDAAIASLKQAISYDPRNSFLAYELGDTYQLASRYADADVWFRRALALDPDNGRAVADYAQDPLFADGDISLALTRAQGDGPLVHFVRVWLLIYQGRYQEALALLDTDPDFKFSFQFGGYPTEALPKAYIYELAGNMDRAKPLYEQALSEARVRLENAGSYRTPQVWQRIAFTELALGHTADGLAAITRAREINAKSNDQINGPWVMKDNALLYAYARRPELAVPLLAEALAAPMIGGFYSPVMLWIDPMWDPIRDDPRFTALLKKYASYKPATALTAAASASGGND